MNSRIRWNIVVLLVSLAALTGGCVDIVVDNVKDGLGDAISDTVSDAVASFFEGLEGP